MGTYYIIWNEAKTEGIITDSGRDANDIAEGNPSEMTLGNEFAELYEEDELTVQIVEIDT